MIQKEHLIFSLASLFLAESRLEQMYFLINCIILRDNAHKTKTDPSEVYILMNFNTNMHVCVRAHNNDHKSRDRTFPSAMSPQAPLSPMSPTGDPRQTGLLSIVSGITEFSRVWLTSFTHHNAFQIHLCGCTHGEFVSF